jgi:dTMP kinase
MSTTSPNAPSTTTVEPAGRGLFATFEGLDGCGKTTQMRLLAERLRLGGTTVVETVEPGGTAIGGAIRSILLDPAHHAMAPIAEMLLYFAARAQNVAELLEPSLARGEVVLSDRWTDSTWAYQGFGRNLGTEVVAELDQIACRGRRPDLTLWIDLDLDECLARKAARNQSGTADRMDAQNRAFYERVQEGYRRLAAAEPGRVVRVDGSGAPGDVAGRVWTAWTEARTGCV